MGLGAPPLTAAVARGVATIAVAINTDEIDRHTDEIDRRTAEFMRFLQERESALKSVVQSVWSMHRQIVEWISCDTLWHDIQLASESYKNGKNRYETLRLQG